MKYFILKAIVKNDRKTVLISEDEFCGSPKDYFVGAPPDAKKIGELEIDGDEKAMNALDGWYESC